MLSKKRFTFHTPYVMILLAIVIISATSTVLEQHAGGEVSANGARDKFEGDFYDKIQVLIHETARADIQIQRDVQGKNHEYPVARDPAKYYHIIIQIDGDGEEEVRLNKRSVVDMLEAAGARDIVPADVLSFVTASVPVHGDTKTVTSWRSAYARRWRDSYDITDRYGPPDDQGCHRRFGRILRRYYKR